MDISFENLKNHLLKLPSIDAPQGKTSIGTGTFDNGNWWVKFSINTDHHLAWRHIQELGHVLNLVSIDEPLPTTFKPVSPPPYMNGGVEFLSWVIESTQPDFAPDDCANWLEGRLPNPVENEDEWNLE